MTSKQRVMAVFEGKPVDRPPVISPTSVATVESMLAVDACFPDVHTQARKMAALAGTGYDLLGFDTVMPYFSVQQEAATLGANVDWGGLSSMPVINTHPYTDPDDFIMPDDFLERLPIQTVLDSIKLLKQKYGDKVAICGKVMGPWTLSYHLYGVEDFLMDTIENPNKTKEFLHAFKEISIKFAAAQIEAGADLITWADHATGDMVGVHTYEEFLWPVHRQCMRELAINGPRRVPIVLHTCGKTLDRMHLFADAGFQAFHFDSKNDPSEALAKVNGRILLTGCVNNVDVLLNGSVSDVKSEVTKIINAGIPLVSPECAVPCKVSNRNLRAICEAAAESVD